MFANSGARGNDLISVTYMPHLSYVRRNKTVSSFGGEHQLVEAVQKSNRLPQIGAPLAGERLYLVPIDSLFRIPYVPPEEHVTSGSQEEHESREQQGQRELKRKERRKILQHWNSIIIYPKKRAPKMRNDKMVAVWWLRDVPLHPMRLGFAWPVDVAMTSDKKQGFLVFPLEPDAERFRPLSELMVNPDDGQSLLKRGRETADQRDSRIALAWSLVKAWRLLHACGYRYGCYDSSNIFYDPKTNEVRLDFSMATLYLPDGHDEPVSPIVLGKDVKSSHMFDYIDPSSKGPIQEAIDQGEQPRAVLSQLDYFAMWAMAFRLMVGRLPLCGHNIPSEPGASDEGRGGDLSDEQVFRENWKAVPKDMRDEMRALFGSSDSLVRVDDGSGLSSGVKPPSRAACLVAATRLVAVPHLQRWTGRSEARPRGGSPLGTAARLVAAARLVRRTGRSEARPRDGLHLGTRSLLSRCHLVTRRSGRALSRSDNLSSHPSVMSAR